MAHGQLGLGDTPNGYFVSKQEGDVAGVAAFSSWVNMMIELEGECH